MHLSALDFLADPENGIPLRLQVFERDGDWIAEAVLRGPEERWYPVAGGLPAFSPDPVINLAAFCERHGLARPAHSHQQEHGQVLTNVTFSDKWRRFRTYGLESSHQAFLQDWYARKFGLDSRDELSGFFAQFQTILEVGTGSGFNTRFMAQHCPGAVFGLDISEAASVTMENTRDLPNCHAINADLFQAPFRDDTFDFAVADGVLHHTPDSRAAMEAVFRKVRPGGQFFFYVYRKMGAMRQFADCYIRERFTKLSPDECYEACEALTELGRELASLRATVTLRKPIEVLGIPAGTHDVQRLLYYNFLKCFWNDAFDFATNNMINFDWYHPHHAWQHTEQEVRGWLSELGVADYQINDANPNGISVLLRKPG